MYRQELETITVDTSDPKSVEEYDRILNNPLCVIISENLEKMTTRVGDSDGGFSSSDRLIKLVTYKEKVLL